MMATNVDTFTEILRWCVWIGMGLAVLVVIGWCAGSIAHRRLRQLERQWGQSPKRSPYDQDAELTAHDMYPRSNVHIPDRVPEGWTSEWQQ